MLKHTPFSISNCARLLLAMSAVYISTTSILVFREAGLKNPFYEYHYISLVILAALLALVSMKNIDFKVTLPSKTEGIYILFSLIAGGLIWWIYRQPILFSNSIWFDEATQFLGPRKMSVVEFAATQQQPPIDYILSKFARLNFGYSDFSVGIHTIVFGILAYFIFGLILMQNAVPIQLLALGLLIYANQNVLLQYSVEARPISISLFFSSLVFLFAIESLQKKKVQTTPLLASSILLLNSTGLQPLFFLPLFSISMFPLLWNNLKKSELIKFCTCTTIAPITLFLPGLYLIYIESQKQHQFHAESHWTLWTKALFELKWSDFFAYLYNFTGVMWILLTPFFVVGTLFLSQKILKIPKDRVSTRWAAASLFYLVSFPLLFQIFWKIIDWNLSPHYFVLWTSGTIIFIFCTLGAFFKHGFSLPKFPRVHFHYELALGIATIILSYCIWQFFIVEHSYRANLAFKTRPDWKSALALASDPNKKYILMELPFAKLNEWGTNLSHYHTAFLYPAENRVIPKEAEYCENDLPPSLLPCYRISASLKNLSEPSDLLFLLPVRDNELFKLENAQAIEQFKNAADEVHTDIRGFIILKLNDKISPIESSLTLYEKIVEQNPYSNRSYYMTEALLAEAIVRGDLTKARFWLRSMEMIVAENVPDQESPIWARLRAFQKKVKLL